MILSVIQTPFTAIVSTTSYIEQTLPKKETDSLVKCLKYFKNKFMGGDSSKESLNNLTRNDPLPYST